MRLIYSLMSIAFIDCCVCYATYTRFMLPATGLAAMPRYGIPKASLMHVSVKRLFQAALLTGDHFLQRQ